MNVYYVAVKYNGSSYSKCYDFMTTDNSFVHGQPVITDCGSIVYVSNYTTKCEALDGMYQWIIGSINIKAMKESHSSKLFENGINENTGEPFKSKNWEKELEETKRY